MRTKFREMSKQYSAEPRPIYTHLTSVIVSRPLPICFSDIFAHIPYLTGYESYRTHPRRWYVISFASFSRAPLTLVVSPVREGILREHLRGADFI